MVADAVGEGERVAFGGADRETCTAAAALLVRHADGAVERRPGVAVAGVEEVEHLAREVEPPVGVEDLGVRGADAGLELALPRRDGVVEGLGARREVIRALDALLVEVDVDGRHPRFVQGEAGAGLGLRAPGPVAVEVEEVVVEPAAGPRLVVLPGRWVGVGLPPAPLAVAAEVALAAVGVEARVDHDDDLAQPRLRAGVARGEGEERRHGGFGADGLVAVHVVAQPDDGLLGLALASGGGERARADGGHVRALGRDDERHERAALRRLAVRRQFDARRRLGDRRHVVDHAVVGREPIAERVAEEGLWRGHLRGGARGENEEKRRESEHEKQGRGPRKLSLHRAGFAPSSREAPEARAIFVRPVRRFPMSSRFDVIVVGAGAAGLMAAIFAAREGASVCVVERSRKGGKKIVVSGGGRCNVLPSEVDPSRFVTDSSPRVLRRMLLAWPLAEQRAFFEGDLGIPLAMEPETGKLFPVSNRATDVRDGLVGAARAAGATFAFETDVTRLAPAASGLWRVDLARGESLDAERVILATGGLSVPKTGSDGFGLGAARALGHAMHPTYPALTPLTTDPAVHAPLAGVSLDVEVHAPAGKRGVRARGGFLFTHRGYSGPSVLDVSHLATLARERGEAQDVLVQWSALDPEAWDRALRTPGAGLVLTTLREHLPNRLAEALLAEAEIPADRARADLRRDERKRLVAALTRYPLPWTGDEGYKKAEVTGGGVALEEVNPATMESRRQPGLFLCGEVLDAFGPIGGYNFMWAWSTGRAAGRAAGARG